VHELVHELLHELKRLVEHEAIRSLARRLREKKRSAILERSFFPSAKTP
jgi:hypothetical protein